MSVYVFLRTCVCKWMMNGLPFLLTPRFFTNLTPSHYFLTAPLLSSPYIYARIHACRYHGTRARCEPCGFTRGQRCSRPVPLP